MGKSCFLCGNKIDKIKKISLHKFPCKEVDFAILPKWIQVCGLTGQKEISNLCICSRHFRNEDFSVSSKSRLRLKPDAVPSICVPHSVGEGNRGTLLVGEGNRGTLARNSRTCTERFTGGAYKQCIVAGCESTSMRYPNKIFLAVPRKVDRRRAWLTATRTDMTEYSDKSRLYVCEDHFNFEEDIENYEQFNYHDSKKIKLKSGVIPHVFECQPDRTAQSSPTRPFSAKKARSTFVEGFIAPVSESFTVAAHSSPQECHSDEDQLLTEEPEYIIPDELPPTVETNQPQKTVKLEVSASVERTAVLFEHAYSTPTFHFEQIYLNPGSSQSNANPQAKGAAEALCLLSKTASSRSSGIVQAQCHGEDKGVQADFEGTNECVMANPCFSSKLTQCSFDEERRVSTRDIATSPIKEFLEPG